MQPMPPAATLAGEQDFVLELLSPHERPPTALGNGDTVTSCYAWERKGIFGGSRWNGAVNNKAKLKGGDAAGTGQSTARPSCKS